MEKNLSITYKNIYHTKFAYFMMLLKKLCTSFSRKFINFWFYKPENTAHLAIQT